MKTIVCLLAVLIAGVAVAQPDADNPTARTLTVPQEIQKVPFTRLENPNQIRGHRFIFSGIAVQAVKTDNPLELINPLAPAEYGSGYDNTVHDPITGAPSGLNILSVKF